MFKNHQASRILTKTIKGINIALYRLRIYVISNLEKILPQTLLNRLILYLTIILFIIFLGLILFIYNKHWSKIKNTLIKDMVSDIYYASVLLDNNFTPSNFMSNIIYNRFYKFNIINHPAPHYLDPYLAKEHKLSQNAKILTKFLTNVIPYTFYIREDRSNKHIIILVLLHPDQWCEFYISSNAFFMKSLTSIMWYTVLIYSLLIIISYVFFKILLRPLKKLSENVTRFGKGEHVKTLTPKGALEIYHTIKAFNEMKERINRYVEQRTLLLSNISHDLKSSLTRMSLMLELTESNETIRDLQTELTGMNAMISNYLNFARNEFKEEPLEQVNIKTFFNDLIKPYHVMQDKKIKVKYFNTVQSFTIKPLTLKRAINNLITNAISHANIVEIIVKNGNKSYLKIIIDDDGPGIRTEDLQNIFKPFFSLNKEGATQKDGVGLGLSIVKDAIIKHGGNIMLTQSPLNGLRVVILIPY